MLARDSASLDHEESRTESYDAAAWGKVAHNEGADLFGSTQIPQVWPIRVNKYSHL